MNNGGRSPRCPVLDKSAAARPLTCAGLIGRQTIKACLSPKCARGRGREHFCHRIQPDHGRVASAVSMGVVQHRPPTQGSRTRILGRLQVASRRKGPVRMATGRLIGHRTPATGPAELSALRARMLMRWPACSRRHRLAADITFCADMGVLPGCSASSRFAGDSVSLRPTNRFA